jgi:hypothetical protein
MGCFTLDNCALDHLMTLSVQSPIIVIVSHVFVLGVVRDQWPLASKDKLEQAHPWTLC